MKVLKEEQLLNEKEEIESNLRTEKTESLLIADNYLSQLFFINPLNYQIVLIINKYF